MEPDGAVCRFDCAAPCDRVLGDQSNLVENRAQRHPDVAHGGLGKEDSNVSRARRSSTIGIDCSRGNAVGIERECDRYRVSIEPDRVVDDSARLCPHYRIGVMSIRRPVNLNPELAKSPMPRLCNSWHRSDGPRIDVTTSSCSGALCLWPPDPPV